MKHILMIEADGIIASRAAEHLNALPCEVRHVATGRAGLAQAQQQRYDLIITDLLLPDMNGVALSHELRKAGIRAPLMMLTAREEGQEKITLTDGCADDYLAKPFSMGEFLARVRAMLRSGEAADGDAGAVIVRGSLVLDKTARKVMLDGAALDFSFKEFDLLQVLMAHPGKTFTREQLLRLIWGYDFPGFEHTVESHISRLRARIEKDPLHPEYILTTWGLGYRFSDTY